MRAVACVTMLFGGTSWVSQTLPPMVEPRPIVIAAEDRGAGIDHDVVLDDRMPGVALDQIAVVVGREMPRAERHGLVDADVVADDRGLADHHAGAVIDEEAASRCCAPG